MPLLTADDQLLTVHQVAQMMQVTPRTIRKRIADHTLPARKMAGGKEWRIRRADAQALLPEPPAPYRPPVIDRLATPEGRAHARAVLARLRAVDSDEEGDYSDAVAPVRFRRWDPETGERLEDQA